ncbi:MAG TPA: hypothetical protein PKA41_17315, partial [Verrucomicrobiota bacterium]|nr:hypothetical protein [Verrucomicrobiota bacterium]
MTKAASVSIGLAVLIAAAAPVWAQSASTDTAVQEAIRRQAETITLRQKLSEAQAAAARKDLPAAARLYDSAYELSQRVGSGVEQETAQTVAGLVSVRLTLARAAQSAGDYNEAGAQISRVLKVDPKNSQALELQKTNTAAIEAQRGKIPSEEAVERGKIIKEEKVAASTLVQDGKLLFEMGKLDEAESKLKQALTIDGGNQAAIQYLGMIEDARLKRAQDVQKLFSKDAYVKLEQAWETDAKKEQLPVPNPYAKSTLIHTSSGRQHIMSKLNQIKIDSVIYDGLPLSEVVRNLAEEAKRRDPDKRGINFLINPNPDRSAVFQPAQTIDPNTGLPIVMAETEAVDVAGIAVKINPPLTDVRLADVLDAIIKVADHPIKYSIEDYAVVFSVKGQESAPLYTRTFKVDPNTFYQGLESVGALSFGDIDTGSSGSGGGGGGG